MKGILLEAYCALAKAWCFLEIEKTERNERKIDELKERIKDIQKEIYKLGGESR